MVWSASEALDLVALPLPTIGPIRLLNCDFVGLPIAVLSSRRSTASGEGESSLRVIEAEGMVMDYARGLSVALCPLRLL